MNNPGGAPKYLSKKYQRSKEDKERNKGVRRIALRKIISGGVKTKFGSNPPFEK